eukprot:Plantae.Rhodophyta-Hildenbrandia_rubra.ctg5116.p1 GENE.Plantae.Rhodophyta-Hildenbrandia_rubra.ctg5116~~Plantae.Rhodophyta-Hildenbrandia_rubra.ctg5116.p1  ORF type:complete len:356 (-),score=60.65 Plantae.Rhodophyta-Hildenbrandia_rubra.ctg5116:325-1392(-)
MATGFVATPFLGTSLKIPRYPNTTQRECKNKQARCTTVKAAATSRHQRREENVPGPLYVDHTCIDCDTCRWLQPKFFTRVNDQSAVYKQPETEEERAEALKAVVACPTGSIALSNSTRMERQEAVNSFPKPVEGLENVYYLYPSKDTFGGSSYLVVREGGQSVMFDCPRWTEKLAKGIEELTGKGGVKMIVLSHCDDVAGHDKWAKRLQSKRVIHSADVNSWQGTTACEVQLSDNDFGSEGLGWWNTGVDGLKVVSVRGHTRGSIAMFDEKSKALFSGDHLYGRGATGKLGAGSRYNQDSWERQIESVAKLEQVPFRAVLPGHGRPMFWKSDEERINAVRDAVKDMRKDPVLRRR